MGQVGAIFSLEDSRLARSSQDWHRPLELCAITSTLVIDEDGCYDPAEFNDGLVLGMKGTFAQAELHIIRARLHGGPTGEIHTQSRRMPQGEWRVVIPDHHPGYITWDQFLANRHRFAANRPHSTAPPGPPRAALRSLHAVLLRS